MAKFYEELMFGTLQTC